MLKGHLNLGTFRCACLLFQGAPLVTLSLFYYLYAYSLQRLFPSCTLASLALKTESLKAIASIFNRLFIADRSVVQVSSSFHFRINVVNTRLILACVYHAFGKSRALNMRLACISSSCLNNSLITALALKGYK